MKFYNKNNVKIANKDELEQQKEKSVTGQTLITVHRMAGTVRL